MDAIMLHGYVEQSISSPYRNSQTKNPRNYTQLRNNPFNSLDNFLPSHFQAAGVLQAPPPPQPFLPHSYASSSLRQPPLGPLVPLPAPADNSGRSNAAVRGQSCPPVNRKGNSSCRSRDPSVSPKKSKFPINNNRRIKVQNSPDQKPLGKTVTVSSINYFASEHIQMNADVFSGSVAFTVSPPPSSLPLPTFSLRPKLGCSAEAAAGIDAGATDNLRRLLRIR